MDVAEVMSKMAARLNQIPGLTGGAHYPKPKNLPPSPCIVITDGGAIAGQSDISFASTEGQLWHDRITVHILVGYQGESQEEESRIDPLVPKVVDAFDPRSWGGVVADALPGLSGHIDSLYPSQRGRGTTTYAGDPCYVAMIVFDAYYARTPELIPLEVTP